jgi:hypothetical protein
VTYRAGIATVSTADRGGAMRDYLVASCLRHRRGVWWLDGRWVHADGWPCPADDDGGPLEARTRSRWRRLLGLGQENR